MQSSNGQIKKSKVIRLSILDGVKYAIRGFALGTLISAVVLYLISPLLDWCNSLSDCGEGWGILFVIISSLIVGLLIGLVRGIVGVRRAYKRLSV